MKTNIELIQVKGWGSKNAEGQISGHLSPYALYIFMGIKTNLGLIQIKGWGSKNAAGQISGHGNLADKIANNVTI